MLIAYSYQSVKNIASRHMWPARCLSYVILSYVAMRYFNQYGYTKLSRLSLHFIRSHNRQKNIKIIPEIQSTKNGLASNGIKLEQTSREVCSWLKRYSD